MSNTRGNTRGRWIPTLLLVWLTVGLTRPQGLTGNVILIVAALLAAASAATVNWRRVSLPWTIVVPPVVGIVSVGWSVSRGASAYGAAVLAIAAVSGLIVVSSLGATKTLQIVERVLRYCVAASVAAGFLVPGIAHVQRVANHGVLQGIYPHPNVLAYVATLAAASTLVGRSFRLPSTWCWATLYLYVILQTKSYTSVFVLAVVVAVFLMTILMQRTDRRGKAVISALTSIAGVLAFATVALNWHRIETVLSQDEGIAGRLQIWDAVWNTASVRPLQGFGIRAGLGEFSESGWHIAQQIGWFVNSTHNGYLSTVLELGLIGAAILAACQLVILVGSFRWYLGTSSPEAAWAFSAVVAISVTNLFETRAFVDVGFFVLSIVAVMSSDWARRSRAGQWEDAQERVALRRNVL